MAEEISNKKKEADIVLFELDTEYSKLKIGYGASFYYHDQALWLSESPLQDPTLVPLDNVAVSDDVLEFDATYEKLDTHFSIYPVYRGSLALARFLKYLSEHRLTISKSHRDSISILIEEDGAVIRLGNTVENKRAVITYSKKHGNTFLERFPDPSKRFQIESCLMKDRELTVTCKGADLHNAVSPISGYTYRWKLDLQEEFSNIVISLLQSAFLREEDFDANFIG